MPLVGASKSVRGASVEEAPRQQTSLEWLGHVRSVTHYGEGDKLESMETLMGLWVPHCGLSNERALSPRVPPFLSLLIEQPPHFVLGKRCILLLLPVCKWRVVTCFRVGTVFPCGTCLYCRLKHSVFSVSPVPWW